MLQTLSQFCANHPQARNYWFNHKLYNASDSYVALAVKLPGCDDQIGAIEFKNCHEMSLDELAKHIQNDISLMSYCFKKAKALQIEHPYLSDVVNRIFTSRHERLNPVPMFARPAISLSNVGHWGYKTAISPLFPNETFKLTLTEIERRQVWNKKSAQFEIQDILPVGISVDHRVFDGNTPLPLAMQEAFDHMFAEMEQLKIKSLSKPLNNLEYFIRYSNTLLEKDLDLGFRYLFALSHVWKNELG